LRALLCASLLALGLVSTAHAADPDSSGSGYSGTGIAGPGTGETGVTPAQAAAKAAELKAYVQNGAMPNRPNKTGAAASYVIALAAATPAYPSTVVLGWYPGFHQKTNYYHSARGRCVS
jgi:hypothetical protein